MNKSELPIYIDVSDCVNCGSSFAENQVIYRVSGEYEAHCYSCSRLLIKHYTEDESMFVVCVYRTQQEKTLKPKTHYITDTGVIYKVLAIFEDEGQQFIVYRNIRGNVPTLAPLSVAASIYKDFFRLARTPTTRP